MGRKEDNIAKAVGVMANLDQIRNIAIAAHIDHGKTTFSDNLLAGAGMISQELAGQQRALDFDPEEQARGITINAACASMVHHFNNKDYLVNLIDTPGHVDFGGDVTRAMRAVAGCIILVCAVEGPMPQTETVVRQALREKVRPTLFINKVDRMVNELKVTPEEMQARFVKIINKVNELINRNLPEEFRGKWGVRLEDGSVMFGSAYHKWGVSVPFIKKSGVTFKDVYKHCQEDVSVMCGSAYRRRGASVPFLKKGRVTVTDGYKRCQEDPQKELAKKAPVASGVLDTVADVTPSPKRAQECRIRHIWHGDQESK